MKSKAIFFVTVLVCGAALLIGCGGGGGGGGGTSTTTGSSASGGTTGANQFAGRWDGTFAQATPTNSGTITLAIAGNGAVSGDTHDTNLNEEGILSGLVSSGGSMAFTVKYPSVTETWNGNASKNGSGHLVGTMNVSGNGPASSFTFDLAPF